MPIVAGNFKSDYRVCWTIMWKQVLKDDRIWFGCLTTAEMTSGRFGFWPIGDESALAGTPGVTTRLCYKSWYATSERYGLNGHRATPGARGGRREFVMVIDGSLICEYTTTGVRVVKTLSYPESVDLPSCCERIWRLASPTARGFTIIRHARSPIQLGGPDEHTSYELTILDLVNAPDQRLFVIPQPDNESDCEWIYLEIFDGTAALSIASDTVKMFSLQTRDYLFFPASRGRAEIEVISPRLRAVILTFGS